MQYVIIVLIVAVAVAFVMVPLLRGNRGAAVGDMDTPARRAEDATPASNRAAVPAGEAENSGFPPERAPAAQPPGEADAEELPVSAPAPTGAPRTDAAGALSPTEREILRYREARRAGTICQYCNAASPPDSKYCMECGRAL